jgi:ABC-type uncharacterized transport system substrate-binding protein
VRRREFITLLGGAAVAWPLAAHGQQAGKVIRIGFIGASLNSSGMAAQYQAFLTELHELGFSEGRNIVVDYRRLDDPRGPFAVAAELMRLQVDLIVATGPEVALQAVVGASRSIPIVIVAVQYDPIERGYVSSLMVLVLSSPFFVEHRPEIAALAIEHRLPTMFVFKSYVEAGGLMSYGVEQLAMYRRLGVYVAKILNGTKPADLPVEQPTRFELVVNLKTAKAIGIELPTSILLRADEVIE